MKHRIAIIVLVTCLALIYVAWSSKHHFEFSEVCYRPGPASCAKLGFAPPEDFSGVRYVAVADADAVGPFVWRIRVAVFDQSIYSLYRESLAFPGFFRKRQSQFFGNVATVFHPGREGAIVEVNLESENRTYWVKLRKVQ